MDDEDVVTIDGRLYIQEDDPEPEDDGPEYPAATLWLPDPDTRHGWGMRHVWPKRPTPRPAPRRHLGFR